MVTKWWKVFINTSPFKCDLIYLGNITGVITNSRDKKLVSVLLAANKTVITHIRLNPRAPMVDNWIEIILMYGETDLGYRPDIFKPNTFHKFPSVSCWVSPCIQGWTQTLHHHPPRLSCNLWMYWIHDAWRFTMASRPLWLHLLPPVPLPSTHTMHTYTHTLRFSPLLTASVTVMLQLKIGRNLADAKGNRIFVPHTQSTHTHTRARVQSTQTHLAQQEMALRSFLLSAGVCVCVTLATDRNVDRQTGYFTSIKALYLTVLLDSTHTSAVTLIIVL